MSQITQLNSQELTNWMSQLAVTLKNSRKSVKDVLASICNGQKTCQPLEDYFQFVAEKLNELTPLELETAELDGKSVCNYNNKL